MNTNIDYSKDDFFDINNQLFRRARNNIGKTRKSIDELDDDEKALGEKNLDIYGAELVNNLKQINYTFRQLEDYVFVPIKEPTKKELKALEAKGSKATVEDIRRPPPPPPPDGLEDKGFTILEKPIIESKIEDEDKDYKDYIPIDRTKDYPASELQKMFKFVIDEISNLQKLIEKQHSKEKPSSESDASPSLKEKIAFIQDILAPDVDYIIYKLSELGLTPDMSITPILDDEDDEEFEALPVDENYKRYNPIDRMRSSDYSYKELKKKAMEVYDEEERMKKIIEKQADDEGATNDETASPNLLQKVKYVEEFLSDEQKYIQSLLNAMESESSDYDFGLPPIPPPPPPQTGEEILELLPPIPPPPPIKNDIIFPTSPKKEDTTIIELMFNGTAPISSLKEELRRMGFNGKLDSIKNWRDVRTVIDNYNSRNVIPNIPTREEEPPEIPTREEEFPNVPLYQPQEFKPTADESPFPDIIIDEQPIMLSNISEYEPQYQQPQEPISLPSVPKFQQLTPEGPLNKYEKDMGNINRFINYSFINKSKINTYDKEYINKKIEEVIEESRIINNTIKEQYKSEPSADLEIYSQGMKNLIKYDKSLEDEFKFLEEVNEQIPELIYRNYEFLKEGDFYNDEEHKNKFDEVNIEILSINKLLKNELKQIGIDLPPNGITSDFITKYKDKIPPNIIDLILYSDELKEESKKIEEKLLKEEESEEESPTKRILTKDEQQRVNYIKSNPKVPVKELRQLMKDAGFPKVFYEDLSKKSILKNLKDWESYSPIGSGRYRGGARKKKKAPEPVQAVPVQAVPATNAPAIPAESTPISGETKEEFKNIGDVSVEREQNSNFELAKEIQEILVEIRKIGQKSPIPVYKTKIDELMTGLIQFIGRTTVLFITRIKKNIKYLDEKLTKEIYEQISKFKYNLEILRNYKNKSAMLIKHTLYNQVEKEAIGLYNEINDGIRNYNRLKSYVSLEPLQGGFFIQSGNPFITHSTTKRFL
jgi:hypothetical protein